MSAPFGPGAHPDQPGPYQPGGPYQGAPAPMGPPLPPAAPPPMSYPAIECTVPDQPAAARHAEAMSAFPQIAALPVVSSPVSAYEMGYAQLPPDRFYQFKMWLQSPEGENYLRWEEQARAFLQVVEPLNALWTQGWIEAELALLRPLYEYLDIYDQFTRQLITHADLNPAARHAQLYGTNDPMNPSPYVVLTQRLPERSQLQKRLASYDDLWRDHLGVEFATGWQTSWGSADNDPYAIAAGLRQITTAVTSRLWSASELPAIPQIPRYQPPVLGVPESMRGLQERILQAAGDGAAVPIHSLPEPFRPEGYPSPMAPANPRWARAEFYTGRAVVYGGRASWAEAVALEVAMGHPGSAPSVCVQRFDGAVGWFGVADIFGVR